MSGPGDGFGRRDRAGTDRDRADREDSGRRGLERLGDLLPDAARHLGLEDQLELAAAMAAWQRIVAERIPAAAGACRIVALSQGVATVEADEPIVAQEVRLRTSELAAALRSVTRAPVRQLRVTLRHV
jgi:predicted nucleic acid-binding Zn ribbon protein